MKGTVAVTGLDELVRTTARISKGAAGELRKEMRVGIGGEFVRDTKARIDAEGLVRKGKLRASIRPAVSGTTLIVRSSPPLRPGERSPQGYAAVYEYGSRPFLDPTLQEWAASGRLEEEFGHFMDWVDNEWGGTGG